MNEIITPGSQSASILESIPLDQGQQPEANNPAATFADRRPTPNVATPYITKNAGDMNEGYTAVLYKASVRCDWYAAKHLLDALPDLVRHSITGNGETALHVSKKQAREDISAATGNVEILKIMAEKNIRLMTIPGANQSMIPLHAAALFGHYEVVKYLYEFKWIYDDWNHQNRVWFLEKCVETDMFVFRSIGLTWEASGKESGALELLRFIWLDIVKRPKKEIDSILRGQADSTDQQQEKAISKKVVQALQLQKLINEHLDKLDEETNNIIRELSDDTQQDTTGTLDQALQLEKLISEFMVNMHVETQNLVKPDNYKHVYDEKDEALGLENLISKHIVWMHEEVQNISKYAFSYEGEDTTEALQNLISKHIVWMHEEVQNISQCMVVAALITTIVFAAAFTIPGGYNQNNGIPIFYGKSTFVAFVVADAMSLFLSSSSILTFLSILTSRYAENDFVESLPKKLLLGVSTLFLSITAMMITFSISFFILYHKEMRWIPILIGAVALIPVVLYVVLQYHVLLDLIRLTYGSKYIFKPGKQYIYYVNPICRDIISFS
ncbi:hypothetical protein QVD17_37043 [Tagetes erecta]|uniref:PGG domain-containing protein n=1 Tax=Tagetes erecta TaxID=13708 RepID=A0AAD8NJH4_TARER|nr:hypothetical protein QVD17_37043 [Tagetes erecta]